MAKIIVASNRRIGSLIIRAGTMSRWSHAALLFGDEVIDARYSTGVSSWSLAEFKRHYPVMEIIDVPLPNEQAAIEFAHAQLGKRYDWTALFGMVLQRNWQEDDSWFCSELAEATLAAGGKQRFRDAVDRITPQQSWAVL